MNFELGKSYIVDVTQKGIIPSMEFDSSEWYRKDQDDLDFLTDEEKILVINDVLDKIKSEICKTSAFYHGTELSYGLDLAIKIVDKYKTESEVEE